MPIRSAWRTATTGYLLPDTDPDQLLTALIGIRNGTAITSGMGRRVSVRLQEEGREREKVALSPRERDVLHALVEGMSYKMIAHSLSISFETVRSHIKRIYEKLHVHSATEAAAKAKAAKGKSAKAKTKAKTAAGRPKPAHRAPNSTLKR